MIMASPRPEPEAVNCVVPTRVILLGEALASVAKGARGAMARRVRLSGNEFATIPDLSRHLGVIQQAMAHLWPRLEGLMTEVVRKEEAGALDAGRAAGRIEQVLGEFVEGYLDVKASRADPDSSEARALIMGVYRHYIGQICAWMEELVEVIADPESAIRKRGIDPGAHVELSVSLDMSSPPGMVKLDALVKGLLTPPDLGNQARSTADQSQPPRLGLLETIGALAFGFGVTKAAFGRMHR